jgi:hypothetical protein
LLRPVAGTDGVLHAQQMLDVRHNSCLGRNEANFQPRPQIFTAQRAGQARSKTRFARLADVDVWHFAATS